MDALTNKDIQYSLCLNIPFVSLLGLLIHIDIWIHKITQVSVIPKWLFLPTIYTIAIKLLVLQGVIYQGESFK